MTYYIIFEENKYKGQPIGIVRCDDIYEQFYTNNSWDNGDCKYYVINLTFNKYIEDANGWYAKYKTNKYKSINDFIKKYKGEI